MKKIIKMLGLLAVPVLLLSSCDNDNTNNATTNSSTSTPAVSTTGDATTPTASTTTTETTTTASHEHTYEHHDAVAPTFLQAGNIEYYYCSECKKYFNANKEEISPNDITISKLNCELSLLVNDTKYDLTIVSSSNGSIQLYAEVDSLKANDTIKIVNKNDSTVVYNYSSIGIDNNKVSDDMYIGCFTLEINENGFHLALEEKLTGICIKINDNLYPMDYVSYYDGVKMTYIYGWVYINGNDVVEIYDLDQKTDDGYLTYNYDDIFDSCAWNTYDYHKGEKGEIIFNHADYYGFELSSDGKINITKTFDLALDDKNYDLLVNGTDKYPLLEQVIEKDTQEYTELTWYLNHEKVQNGDKKKNYLKNKGLSIYTLSLSLDADSELIVMNSFSNTPIGASNVVSVFGDKDCVNLENAYIKINKQGTYCITYMPLCNSITISVPQQSSGDIMMMTGGKSYPLSKDSSGNVTYEGDVAQYDNFMFFTNDNNIFEIKSVDTKLPATTCNFNSEHSSLMFYKEGHYKLTLNLDTQVLKVEGEVSSSTSAQYGCLSIIDLSGSGNKTESMTKGNNTFSITIDLKQNNIISVSTYDESFNSTQHLDLDSNVSSDIAESYLGIGLLIKSDGNYTVTYNCETDLITIVKN